MTVREETSVAQCAGTGGSFCRSMFLLWVWHKLHAWNGAMAFPARPSLSDKAPTSARRAKAGKLQVL